LTKYHTIGLDLGSSYVKAVVLDAEGEVVHRACSRTGYDFQQGVQSLLVSYSGKISATGVTGYGRYDCDGEIKKTEISCLALASRALGLGDCSLVDIGGQDCKVLQIVGGKAGEHKLNRRCAAGTGSYLEFLGFRLGLQHDEMDKLAASTQTYHPLNSFCTVFASTEILDCMRSKVPMPELIRGMYASIVERTREMSALADPLYLSGGVIEHHPVLLSVFEQVLGFKAKAVPHPQYMAAMGAALYARETANA
jgi:predicted CoA-substrate-specific enzyme activase